MTRLLIAHQASQNPIPDEPAPWNIISDGTSGLKISDILDTLGESSGVSLSIGAGSSLTVGGSSAAFSSAHQGYARDAWRGFWSSPNLTETFEFSGFAPNQTGTVKFGAWVNVGRDTKLTDQEGNTATAIAKAEPPNTVATLNWQADASGNLVLELERVSVYSYIQFFDFEYTAAAQTTVTQDVTIPDDIDLQWEQSYELAVTDLDGTYTLPNIPLRTPTGWSLVPLTSLNPNAGDTEDTDVRTIEYFSRTDTGLGGAGYTPIVGDELAFTTQAGLTVNGDTSFTVTPAADVIFTYKWWDSTLQTWTAESTCTIDDLGLHTAPTPTILSINGNNQVEEGDARVDILTTAISPTSVTQQVTLNGIPLTITGWTGVENDASIEVTIPDPIALVSGTYTLQVTHDAGTTSLEGVQLTSTYTGPSIGIRVKRSALTMSYSLGF